MRDITKQFIEQNIELIQQNAFDDLYDVAYDQLSDDYVRELTDVLETALDTDVEKYAKENIIKHFEESLQDFLKDKSMNMEIYLSSFVRRGMMHVNGLDWDEFQLLVEQYLKDDSRVKVDNDGVDLFIVRVD